ncbi:MAG: ABC transporter permease [Acidobacteriaceae bacterium]
MSLTRRILNLFSRDRINRDIDAELQAHIDLRAEDNIAAGMSPEAARRDARLRFGNPVVQRERTIASDAALTFERVAADLRCALRQLRKFPLFAATVILTLALGIGATTAVFSAMNAVLLRRLPVPHPQQLAYLLVPDGQPYGASNTGDSDSSFSLPVFTALRQNQRAFSDLMAFVPLSIDKVDVRTGDDQPEQASGEMVSGNFLSGLGVSMARGRAFTLADENQHAAIAVLSYPYWNRRFSHNPAVLGQTIYVKGVPFTIIGVTAQGFSGVEPGDVTDFWIPLQRRTELNPWGSASDVSLYGTPNWWCLRLIARLAPGVSPQQAVAALTPAFRAAAFANLGATSPSQQQKLNLVLAPAKGLQGPGDYDQEPIRILMALVALVLLIACGNVAMLIVARNASRQRDFSLRLALGANRGTLLRQLFTESGLLVAAGASLGWIFALAATRALAAWSRIDAGLAPDRTVLLFTTAISILAALVFGLAPLRTAARAPLTGTLRTSSGTSSHSGRSGPIVLTLQIALCFTLLAAAGLLMRTLLNYERTSLGMRMPGLLVFGITPQQPHTSAERFAFYDDLLNRMRALPGVDSATLMGDRIGSGWSENDEPTVDGVTRSFQQIPLRANNVGPDFLRTLGIPLLAGRDLRDSDTPTSARVVIVNETFVKKLLPHSSPLGHRLGKLDDPKHEPFTIVGVAKDSKYRSVDEAPHAMAYFPYAQMGDAPSAMEVEVHVQGDALALLPSVERAIHSLDANLPLEKPMTQAAVFEDSYSDQRLFARLSLFFGLLAALLVAIGLYGMLSYRISRRTTEIGVRMAMGARQQQILVMILRESFRIVAIGVALGLPLALLTTHFMASMLYNLAPTDAPTLCAALAGILAVGLAAGFVPARRAASIDPMQALRSE